LSEGMRRPNFIGLMIESVALESDAGDVGARDGEGEEGQGGALEGESRAEAEEDWGLCGVKLGLRRLSRSRIRSA